MLVYHLYHFTIYFIGMLVLPFVIYLLIIHINN